MRIQPEELIRRAADDGVLLVISSQGRVKAKGAREAVDEWLPRLRQHKAKIIDALSGGSDPLVNRHTGPNRNLERVLKGQAIALYCDSLKQTLWLVADEEDARLLGERRGVIYTADEIRLVASIDDPGFVRDVHAFKNQFNVAAKRDGGSEVLGKSRGNNESTI